MSAKCWWLRRFQVRLKAISNTSALSSSKISCQSFTLPTTALLVNYYCCNPQLKSAVANNAVNDMTSPVFGAKCIYAAHLFEFMPS